LFNYTILFTYNKFLTKKKKNFIDILSPYGLDEATVSPIIEKLKNNPEKFVDFMMKFELNLERPDPSRSVVKTLNNS
jgi:hypothetical protein